MSKILRTYQDIRDLKPGEEIVFHTPDEEIQMNFLGIAGMWSSTDYIPGCEMYESVKALKQVSGNIVDNLVEIPLIEAGIFRGEDGNLSQNWLTSTGKVIDEDHLKHVLSQIKNK